MRQAVEDVHFITHPVPLALQLAREHQERRARMAAAAHGLAKPLPRPPDALPPVVAVQAQPTRPCRPRATPDRVLRIQCAVALAFGVALNDLLSARRTKPISRARHVAMYLAFVTMPNLSSSHIAKLFDRDHSTMIHAIQVVNGHMDAAGDLRARIETLLDKIDPR